MRDPVERPPALSGAFEVLEEATAEMDDVGMIGGVGIARAVVEIVEGVTTDKDKGGGETESVEVGEADTELDTDAEVGTAGVLVGLAETDVAETTEDFGGTVGLRGGTITLVGVGLGGTVEVSFPWRATTIPL